MLDRDTLRRWFCSEILPLERPLTRYIRRHWSNESEVADLRQEIYARILDGTEQLPLQAKPFLFVTARNHLINCAKRGQIILFENVVDLEASSVPIDTITPERISSAREELRRVQAALGQLPPRCREVVMLRKLEGLSQREVAERMGISVGTVEQYMVQGMRQLVDLVIAGSSSAPRKPALLRVRKARPR